MLKDFIKTNVLSLFAHFHVLFLCYGKIGHLFLLLKKKKWIQPSKLTWHDFVFKTNLPDLG